MPSPLTPIINKALANKNTPTAPGQRAPGQAGVQFQAAPNTGLATGKNTFTPVAGDALSGPQTNATPVSGQSALSGQQFGDQSGLKYEGLSPANQALLGTNAPQNTGLGDTSGTGTNPFLQALYNEQQSLGSILGPQAQQMQSDALNNYTIGSLQNSLTGQEGNQAIAEQQSTGNENILQAQLANQLSQQQLATQEQYDPQLYAITQGQQALQGKGLGLQEQGIWQQEGQAGNTLKQSLLGTYGNEATSGAVGTEGTKNSYQQDHYNYTQALQNLERQSKQVELNKQGLGLSEQQSAIGYKEQQASLKQQQESINNVAQRIGFDSQDLQNRIGNAMSNLGISQQLSQAQVFAALEDSLNGIPNQLSSILPYILQSANVPNLLPSTSGTGTGTTP